MLWSARSCGLMTCNSWIGYVAKKYVKHGKAFYAKATELTDLSTDLCVEFSYNRTGRVHVELHLDEDPPAILVSTASPYEQPIAWSKFRMVFSACCRWLTLQAPLIRKLQLSNANKCASALVRQMVLALKDASLQTQPAIAITMPTGNTLTEGHVIATWI